MALIGSVNNLAIGKGGGDVANNTAVGTSSLGSNTTGYNNSAVGQGSLSSTTTGIQNTAIGRNAGSFNTTGSYNTFVGDVTGQSANTATRNTFVGAYSGYFASGERNTFVGMDSGFDITTGTKNTIIGRYTGNQDGLDIRTSSKRVVVSDGDGAIALYSAQQDITIETTDVILTPQVNYGGLAFISGYNFSGGAQGWWLVAFNYTRGVKVIDSDNGTGLTVTFTRVQTVGFTCRLDMKVSSGRLEIQTAILLV